MISVGQKVRGTQTRAGLSRAHQEANCCLARDPAATLVSLNAATTTWYLQIESVQSAVIIGVEVRGTLNMGLNFFF